MALVDLPPDMVDARLKQWAAIARPDQPWVQVATLMHMKVPANWQAADMGQPQELALGLPNQPATGLAQLADAGLAQLDVRPAPMESRAEAAPQAASVTTAQLVSAPPLPTAEPSRYEVSAQEKDPAIVPAYVRQMAAKPPADVQQRWSRALRSGEGYVVQIGAYRRPQAAARSWAQTAKRWRHLEAYAVHQARVQSAKGIIYRVSLGKFASREAARRLCGQLRAQGGSCFPRAVTGFDTLRYAAKAPARPRLLALR